LGSTGFELLFSEPADLNTVQLSQVDFHAVTERLLANVLDVVSNLLGVLATVMILPRKFYVGLVPQWNEIWDIPLSRYAVTILQKYITI